MPRPRIPKALKHLAVPLEAVSLDPANVRTHDERNLEAIRASLRRFGQQKPIVVDAKKGIVAGNATYLAARSLGWTEIAAIRTSLTGNDRAAYAVADNRTAELAAWNQEALAALLSDLQADDAALLASAGFTEDEFAALMEPPEAPEGINEVPAPPDEAETQKGDLWELGGHRLLCGNSVETEDVDRLLKGVTVHLVNMDPPYNVRVEPRSATAIAAGQCSDSPLMAKFHHQQFDRKRTRNEAARGAKKKMRPKDRALENDFLDREAFANLLRAWFGQTARVLKPGRSFYIWGGYSNFANYPPALEAAGLYFSQCIVWVKGHPVLTRKDFLGNHEWCFYGWKKGGAHFFADIYNVPDVWEFVPEGAQTSETLEDGLILESGTGPDLFVTPTLPRGKRRRLEAAPNRPVRFHTGATDVWRVRKVPGQAMVHLTEKPVELALRAMHYSSRRGENVLDLFGGSGSTLMAAEVAGRRAYLMELDPLYCDVIVERWQKHTGKKARRRGRRGQKKRK